MLLIFKESELRGNPQTDTFKFPSAINIPYWVRNSGFYRKSFFKIFEKNMVNEIICVDSKGQEHKVWEKPNLKKMLNK